MGEGKNKKLRVFEAFAGYGSQRMALRNIGIPFEIVGISDVTDLKPYCIITIGYPAEGWENKYMDKFDESRIHYEKY